MKKDKGKTVQQNLKWRCGQFQGDIQWCWSNKKITSFAEDELTQNLRGSGKEVRIRRQLRPLGLVGPRTYHTGKDQKKTAWKKMSWRKESSSLPRMLGTMDIFLSKGGCGCVLVAYLKTRW